MKPAGKVRCNIMAHFGSRALGYCPGCLEASPSSRVCSPLNSKPRRIPGLSLLSWALAFSCQSSDLLLSSIRQRLLAFASMVIVSCHGAQLAFVGIFCGFARARLERNQDLRNQQVAIRDIMLGAEPRNLLICPHVVSDQDRKNSLLRRLPLSL